MLFRYQDTVILPTEGAENGEQHHSADEQDGSCQDHVEYRLVNLKPNRPNSPLAGAKCNGALRALALGAPEQASWWSSRRCQSISSLHDTRTCCPQIRDSAHFCFEYEHLIGYTGHKPRAATRGLARLETCSLSYCIQAKDFLSKDDTGVCTKSSDIWTSGLHTLLPSL